jgi:hypothetical protein
MVAEIPSKGDAPIMLDFNASAAPNTKHQARHYKFSDEQRVKEIEREVKDIP